MKKVEANIRVQKVKDVMQAFAEVGIATAITTTEVRSFTLVQPDLAGGNELDFQPQVRVEILVADALVGRTVEVLERAARTERIGDDGRIWVMPVEEVIRVRTGERGEAAL